MIDLIIPIFISTLVLLLISCIIKLIVFGEDEKIYGFRVVSKTFIDEHTEYEIHRKIAHHFFFFVKFWESFRTYDTYNKAKECLLQYKKEYEEKLAKTTVTKKIEIL